MIFEYQKDKIFEIYPFLNEKNDKNTAIINFFNLDAVRPIGFSSALYVLYPAMEKNLFNYLYDDKINENTIYPYTKTGSYIIINIPAKHYYNELFDFNMIAEGIKKINTVFNTEENKINKMIFSKDTIDNELLIDMLNKIDNKIEYEIK